MTGIRDTQAEEDHDDFVNEILERTRETWDGDEAAEAIAVRYVRRLESLVSGFLGRLPTPADDSAVADQIVTWDKVEEGDLVLFRDELIRVTSVDRERYAEAAVFTLQPGGGEIIRKKGADSYTAVRRYVTEGS